MKFPDKKNAWFEALEIFFGASIISLGFVVVLFCIYVVQTFVITKLWAWYIVDFFHVQPMSLITAFGIVLLFNFMNPIQQTFKDEVLNKDGWWLAFIRPFAVLALGYIGTFFQ